MKLEKWVERSFNSLPIRWKGLKQVTLCICLDYCPTWTGDGLEISPSKYGFGPRKINWLYNANFQGQSWAGVIGCEWFFTHFLFNRFLRCSTNPHDQSKAFTFQCELAGIPNWSSSNCKLFLVCWTKIPSFWTVENC